VHKTAHPHFRAAEKHPGAGKKAEGLWTGSEEQVGRLGNRVRKKECVLERWAVFQAEETNSWR